MPLNETVNDVAVRQAICLALRAAYRLGLLDAQAVALCNGHCKTAEDIAKLSERIESKGKDGNHAD